MTKRNALAIGTLAVLGMIAASPNAPQLPSPEVAASAPASAQDVIDRMTSRDAGLRSYTVRVHVHMRTSIPFYNPKLDGTTYYKRPDDFAVVFDSVPGYMKSFQKLFDDVGDPTGWQKDQNVRLAGTVDLNGHQMIELVLTKKIYSDQTKDTLAYVDPATYELAEMQWQYTNGDTLTMTQSYQNEDGFRVVTHQHLEGKRRVRVNGDADYEQYHTNVAISDSVFNK